MNNLRHSIPVALLLLLLLATLPTSAAGGQTRRRKVVSRRTAISRPAPRQPIERVTTSVPCPPSMSATTPSGLTYLITRHGTGQALKAGQTVTVNYTGLLTNGTKFDSSLDRQQPFAFQLGAGRVIKGWDEGVAQLRVGDQATLIIPPQLGYGARGAGASIPPDATLIFIIEVMDAKESAPPTGATSQ